jgi:dienelactone hydrolase
MKSPHLSRRGFLASSLAAWSLPAVLRAVEVQGPARHDVPWLADVQTPPATLPADAPRLPTLLVEDDGRKIASLAAWQPRREKIRRWWLDFLGPVKIERKTPPRLTVVEEDRPEGIIRQKVRYEVEPGMPGEAYLLRPARQSAAAPGVVVLHSTVNYTIRQGAGLEGAKEKAFGLDLARQGYVAICPRCFLWPNEQESPEDKKLPYTDRVKRFQARHPGCRGMAKMLFDAVAALDILAALPGVDPQRLGAVGHSLGAKEVLYLAALDERIKAAVSSEGGIGTRFSNWEAPWYLGQEIRHSTFTHEHHELLALAAPRAFLLLGGDSADGDRSWPFIEAALPAYRLYGGTPRLGLFNHRKGHSVPPEAERRIDEWFAAYL